MSKFYAQGREFFLDGKAFRICSGAIHYFRVPRPYWKDRLLKLKEIGFNTVETYVAWNMHEKRENVFDFSDNAALGAFLDTAAELGLYAIVRPGPYICAEWEFGGLPYWLLKNKEFCPRCDDSSFVPYAERFLRVVCKQVLAPRMVEQGGNVLMVQLENEYGSYGGDKTYLKKLLSVYDECLPSSLVFTTDGADKFHLQPGTLENVLATVTFGSKPLERMAVLEQFADNQPMMCAEFWCGWFDSWHGERHVRKAEEVCADVEEFLQKDYHFNFYMFHGGTNFGFMNGANGNSRAYDPDVTSYDYCALLNEAGDRTPAYYGVRELMIKYGYDVPPLTATESEKAAYGEVQFTGRAMLFEQLDKVGTAYRSAKPKYMEDIDQAYGYVFYRTYVQEDLEAPLSLDGLGDRANIYLNDKPLAIYERGREYTPAKISVTKEKPTAISLLVENMGRVNYGPQIAFERKGVSAVRVHNRLIFGWESVSLPMDNLEKLTFAGTAEGTNMPAFYKAEFNVEKPCDTFLETYGFSKGFVVLNGFNLGRYYTSAGPQQTLYVPACYLKKGKNELIVFDSDGTQAPAARFVDKPILGW